MSVTSTVITIAICAIIAVALGLALVKGLWSAAKKITIPLQIALFVVMLVCVVRLFGTKENAQRLYRGIEESGISQSVEGSLRAVLTREGRAPSRPNMDSTVAEREGRTPSRPNDPHLEISFADNAYRVTVECPGDLNAAEKKAVGRQILAALGQHLGKAIARVDKSQVSIESRYDEASDTTRVVAVIPPDAILD